MNPDPYGFHAPWFEALEALYAGGAVAAAKRRQDPWFGPDKRVLYVGAGAAGEARAAAAKGARVTLLEPSPAMGRVATKRFARRGLAMTLVPETLEAFKPEQRYDLVVANFFLNIFPMPDLTAQLKRLTDLVAPNGHLLIADFEPWRSGPMGVLQRCYWSVGYWLAAKFTGDKAHPLYDYRPLLHHLGWREQGHRCFRIWGLGPRWIYSASFSRCSKPHSTAAQ